MELNAKLAIAKNIKNMHLCRIINEALKKQADSDTALAIDDFDKVIQLDAEVIVIISIAKILSLQQTS